MDKTLLKWMEYLGREAHQHNTIVDVLCTAGIFPVWVPVLQEVALGVVLLLHDHFGVNLQRASSRAAGSHGEIRCSDDILITPVVGSGEEAHIESHEIFKNESVDFTF